MVLYYSLLKTINSLKKNIYLYKKTAYLPFRKRYISHFFYLNAWGNFVLIKIYYEIFQACKILIHCTNIMQIYTIILK